MKYLIHLVTILTVLAWNPLDSIAQNRNTMLANSFIAQSQAPTVTLKLYPNPSQGLFQLNVGHPEDMLVEAFVYNIIGQEVTSTTFTTNRSHEIDMSLEEDGLYWVKIKFDNYEKIKTMVLRK